MGQEYSSLSMEEHAQLGLLASQKLSQRQIVMQLGRSASTLGQELARNRYPKRGYLAAGAQQKLAYIEAMLNDRPRTILDFHMLRGGYAEIVQAKLAERLAPAAKNVALQT